MIDREKVIKGLECCEHLSGEYCKLCPYHEDITADTPDGEPCWNGALAHDALALLKAQEPRVMTLEEIQELHVYWVEDYNGSLIPETVMCIEPHFGNLEGSSKEIQTIPVVRMGNGYAPVITKINHHYNIKWRCWTVRPTDEQREAVEWK